MPLHRFRIRTLMIAVGVVAFACFGADQYTRWRDHLAADERSMTDCRFDRNKIPILDPIPGEPSYWHPE